MPAGCALLGYGSETYTLGDKEKKRINSFNSKRLARITGNTQQKEARRPTYDLVAAITKTQATWLGHILRMDEDTHIIIGSLGRYHTTKLTSARLSTAH